MQSHVHHGHLFTSNLDAALKFYQEMFGAKILADLDLAGAPSPTWGFKRTISKALWLT
jgi:catechol 2,3-dioxygenase-like lactoylglutathione lyase family enzyme